MIYIGFKQDKNIATAMIDPKDMTMKGSITTPNNEVRPLFAKKQEKWLICISTNFRQKMETILTWLSIYKYYYMEKCGDELEQLLIGSWGAMWSRGAV